MIDMFQVEERLEKIFAEVVVLRVDSSIDEYGEEADDFAVDGDGSPDFCGVYSWPLQFSTVEHGVEATARLYERVNGTMALCIEAFVVEVDDSPGVHRWLTVHSSNFPFVHPRVSVCGDGRVRVWATHSFLADSVTAEQIRQSVGSIDYMVPTWIEQIRAAEVCDDHEADGEECADESSTESARDATSPGQRSPVALVQLNAMVGLAEVKAFVHRLADTQHAARIRRSRGLRAVEPSPHLVFTGNPGTGKTTVARHVGRLYRDLGILARGHVVEVDRSGLVAGYVGQTALKTKEALDRAKGGVLFVDEAYSLVGEGSNDYGDEAIETIITHMENQRGDVVVVVAGYPAEMDRFLQSNPGLASRFDHRINFPDYSRGELQEIFVELAASHDYDIDPSALAVLGDIVGSWPRQRGFGNAREVRRLFHEVVARHGAWILESGITDGAGLRILTAEHLRGAGSGVHRGGARHAGYL